MSQIQKNASERMAAAIEKGMLPWGDCIRGCPPSYIDREGFCSPACHYGAPRGEYVTVKYETTEAQPHA